MSNLRIPQRPLPFSFGQQRTKQIWQNAVDRVFRAQQLSLAGKTPFDVIYQRGLLSVRHYHATTAIQHRVPLVIVPPLAVNMLIYDLFPQRSLVRYLLSQGFDVYLIDWGKPSFSQAHYDYATYVQRFLPECFHQIRTHSGQQQLSLHGWSLGGAMSLTYAALFNDQDIKNVVILGSPIDTHRSGMTGRAYQFISRRAAWVRSNTRFRLHQLPSQVFHVHGLGNTIGFKLTDPVSHARGYLELFQKLHDREYVVNHATSGSFIDNMLAYPGGVMRDLILRFWIDNELSTGQVRFGNQTADLADFKGALLAVAGATDNIVTLEAVRPVTRLVGSTDKTFMVVSGGHMGIVSGSQAPEHIWPQVAAWLAERSS